MRAAKYILILLLILVISGAIYFSLKDGSYSHTREIRVDAPTPLVYQYLANQANWQELLSENYPEAVIQIEDNEISYASGQKQGTIELSPMPADTLINFSVAHSSFMTSDTAEGSIRIRTQEGASLVTFIIEGDQGFSEKISATVDRNHLMQLSGEALSENGMTINNIAAKTETDVKEAMAVTSVTPNGMVELSGGYYLYLTTESKSAQLPVVFQQQKDLINNYMRQSGIENYGEAHQFFLEGSPITDRSRVAVGVPVRERIILGEDTNVTSYFLEPHSAVKLTLRGDRKNIASAYREALEYLSSLGLLRSELPAYMIYKNSTDQVVNPADLRTEIYLPVE
jgi:hypothetical protein